MSGRGRQDGGGGSGQSPGRADHGYIAPPHIRTTGEIPAVTGEVPAAYLPNPSYESVDQDDAAPGWSSGGSVVDRPAPAPPDWMSGVQVPELLVTRDLEQGDGAGGSRRRLIDSGQRLLGLVLVAVLVAVVVLVLASAVSRF